jgi:hypothetical protein
MICKGEIISVPKENTVMFQLGYQENTAELSLHSPAVEDKKKL